MSSKKPLASETETKGRNSARELWKGVLAGFWSGFWPAFCAALPAGLVAGVTYKVCRDTLGLDSLPAVAIMVLSVFGTGWVVIRLLRKDSGPLESE